MEEFWLDLFKNFVVINDWELVDVELQLFGKYLKVVCNTFIV
jgi:hypothetical protein